MEEKNKDSLKKAIDNLPKYSPEANLWDKLSNSLEQAQAEAPLHEAIEKLPVYQAPEQAWTNIERELPAIKRRLWPGLLAAAASIAILIGFMFNQTSKNFEQEIVSESHKVKEVPSDNFIKLAAIGNAQRDSAFKAIVRGQKASNDRAKEILAELDELKISKQRLKSRLSKYDINKNLELKLNQIEQESEELQQAYLAATI